MMGKTLCDGEAQIDVPALGITRVPVVLTLGPDRERASEQSGTLDAKAGLDRSDEVAHALHLGETSRWGRRGRERVQSGTHGVAEQEDVVVALLSGSESARGVPGMVRRLSCHRLGYSERSDSRERQPTPERPKERRHGRAIWASAVPPAGRVSPRSDRGTAAPK